MKKTLSLIISILFLFTAPASAQDNVKQLHAGDQFSAVLAQSGVPRIWGAAHVQPMDQPITQMAAGFSHLSTLTPEGLLISKGINAPAPTHIQEPVRMLSAGNGFTLVLTQSGEVRGWGDNTTGCLNIPANLPSIKTIATGSDHCLAVTNKGRVTAWGADWSGQSQPPAGLDQVVAVAAGFSHSLALRVDGTVVGWGANGFGQAQPPSGLVDVIAIAAAGDYSLALTAKGRVMGWGSDEFGQWRRLSDLRGVVEIAAAPYHALALTHRGAIIADGANFAGELDVPVDFSLTPYTGQGPLFGPVYAEGTGRIYVVETSSNIKR